MDEFIFITIIENSFINPSPKKLKSHKVLWIALLDFANTANNIDASLLGNMFYI